MVAVRRSSSVVGLKPQSRMLIIARKPQVGMARCEYATEEETKKVSRGRGGEGLGKGADWDAEGIESSCGPEEEGRKAQADAGKVAGRSLGGAVIMP
jgi:hypothetical protein